MSAAPFSEPFQGETLAEKLAREAQDARPPSLSPEQARAEAERLGPSTGRYYRPLQGLYGMIGLSVYAFDRVCGTAILASADNTARAMDKLARENRAVARMVERLLTISTFGLVLEAHAPILIAVMSHHASDQLKESMRAAFTLPFKPPETDEAGEPSGNGGPR